MILILQIDFEKLNHVGRKILQLEAAAFDTFHFVGRVETQSTTSKVGHYFCDSGDIIHPYLKYTKQIYK